MTEQPKRILVITIDPTEAAFRLRLAILADLLADDGYTFDFKERPGNFTQRLRLIATADQYDAVIVQRKLLDPSHARLLRRLSLRIFFDLDDAVMVQRRKISRWSQWLKNRRFIATARAADHVVAGNQYLATRFRELGTPVTVLPTVVDPFHYLVKAHTATDLPALVWIGSKSTLPYLKQWMPAIEAAGRRVPGLRLITIANGTVDSDVVEVVHRPWSQETEAISLHLGDIGIAPTPIDPWSIGKSGFKIIQYMATGLPVIASPVGANADILQAGNTGVLAESVPEWTEAIVQLAGNVTMRAKMGAAGRQRVMECYTLSRAREVWAGLLSGRMPSVR
jgi:glycosyltransferase involved in cell wall biosynthesis